MRAAEHDPSRERRLRRTVAELGSYPIEDVEAIWDALSPDEREQLRPLLAEAARVAPGSVNALGIAEAANRPETATSAEISAETATRVARLSKTLPNGLMARILFCVDGSARERIVPALAADQRALLAPTGHTYEITPRARAALQNAVFAASRQLDDSPAQASATPPVEPFRSTTLGQRVRRWIGRSA
ncbi:hypothetical protein [Paraburkholderia terricola]|uniref:DUF222 domain-containing protein n=1 Tax=Paraburkholderia terricola TaxID=169427 RepID=A0ABU1LX39_9BURK|nr:hypothetical protein [Paraburkholderia terricola]MDR6411312.1 hypothetical protein [Paraburkholderia terricola]MDR6483448.1 hypothetical protein [Paraburkholderia terricola]